MELRETTTDRLRKRLGRDPTEEEIKGGARPEVALRIG